MRSAKESKVPQRLSPIVFYLPVTRRTKLLIAITAAICTVMFAAGLKPKGFRLHNTASWLVQTNCIDFGKLGIAYTDNNHSPAPESLSIKPAIRPPLQHRNHLDVISDLWDTHNQIHSVRECFICVKKNQKEKQ
jgi:hypothetical protein